MDKLPDLSVALQLSAAGISFAAALYLARFKYSFIEELKKIFIPKPEQLDDWPVSRRENRMLEEQAAREHERFDKAIEKLQQQLSQQRRGGGD